MSFCPLLEKGTDLEQWKYAHCFGLRLKIDIQEFLNSIEEVGMQLQMY